MTEKNFAPVRVGVIGLGRFGKLHSLTLAGLAEAELAGVVARREESLQEFDALFPDVPGWTETLVAELAEIYDDDVIKIRRMHGVNVITP